MTEPAITLTEWAQHSREALARLKSDGVVAGTVASVFLGSRGTKIVRHSPVPVLPG